ncbi:MAG: winged helix-turn-helix transcriptional regulator [Clostridia bacterium]|nr:winged helix-turn-helix transcriptional regulator [Clostridia bacterium]
MENFSEIAVCIENISKKISKIKQEKTAKLGIRNAHFTCMMHIDLSPDGLTPTEISRDCNVDKAFVSRTTADLIKGGFICTNAKFHDGRKYRNKYILTERGKEVICDIKNAIEEYFAELGSKVGEYEIKSFLKVVVSINGIIEKQVEA